MASGVPRVSIIMATYNWSTVLPYSIASVLQQSFADFELLVVGDGCTDDSAEVVAAIGDDRVHWIGLAENSGHQSTPANEGLRRARGEIIAYLGHDDLWLPDHLFSLVRAIDDGADLAYGVTRWVWPEPAKPPLSAVRDYQPGIFVPPSSVAHRRAVIDRTGGWRDYRTLTEDPETDLWRRVHAAGFRFAFVPKVTLIKFPAGARTDVYRQRPFHEQAEWLERIRRDPDLGSAELVDVLCNQVSLDDMRYGTLAAVVWRQIRRRLRRRWTELTVAPPAAGTAIDALRRNKGLEPARNDRFGASLEPS